NSDFSNWAKHIYIDANIDNDTPYFIRVKAFAPLDVSFSDSEGVWRNGDDGYCYYSGILSGGDASSELNAQLQIPEYFEETCEEFDFVTIVEAVPVMYDENGNPYADWNATVGSNEGGA
ncbi:MAG TPA: hypothetical protein DCY94_05250, partial [Firmicutes bacterium]|nr:hypothetical protein [Bacillota bacterium]